MEMGSQSGRPIVAISILGLCLLGIIIGLVRVVQTAGGHPVSGSSAKHSVLSTDKLALLSLDGMIMETPEENNMFNTESNAAKVRRLLYQAAKDDNIKGVLLRINSPGGTVGMSQELYSAVLAVRKQKPIVVSMGDLAASGGYYTASAADKIVANPGTLTASIGVILHSMNLKGLVTDKLGVQSVTIKSGKFKDILSPYRPATPEELKLLQNLIDTSYHQFLHAVLYGRTMDVADPALKQHIAQHITAIADGRVVIGEDAMKIGLVDQLGGQEDAKLLLQNLAAQKFHLKHPDRLKLSPYETPFTLWQLLGLDDDDETASMSWLGSVMHWKSTATNSLMPSSVRFANQPLWLMETVN